MHTYVAAHIVAGQLMNLAPRINTFNGTQGGSGVDGEAEGGRVAMGYDLIMAFLEKNPARPRFCSPGGGCCLLSCRAQPRARAMPTGPACRVTERTPR